MKIGLVDVDGHAKKKKWGATVYPNLALAKIARYWRNRGGANLMGYADGSLRYHLHVEGFQLLSR